MTRTQIFGVLAVLAALPAAGIEGGAIFSAASDRPCFSTGNVGYRLTGASSADYTVKIDNAAARPDVTLQIVDDPTAADFVLADGAETTGSCLGVRGVRTVRVDTAALEPDLTISLELGAGQQYKIYANSGDFSAQDAAALFAVMVRAERKSASLRSVGSRDDITGALPLATYGRRHSPQ